ncbi:hypothetical protein BJV78DRAFT_1234674 [Lactifluus subvellereus]|nr:hypothetical protein BJV78DRAFT_1234674 [Lactifluus subvellereus]
MVWQRGSRSDYDVWGTSLGNEEEWTFEELLPFFRRSENWTAPSSSVPALFGLTPAQKQALSEVHGSSGPMQVSYNNFLTDLDVLRHRTQRKPDDGTDLSMPAQGVARTVDSHTGLRSHSASAYFATDALSRIIFDGRMAKAVEFQSDGKCTKEAVLAAGSIKTPQILELSGVGNRTLLENLGIPVVLDLNLQDHPVTLSDFGLKPGVITLVHLYVDTNALIFVCLISRHNETNKLGVFTYSVADIGTITLQSMTTPSEFRAMRASLDKELVEKSLTPLQKVQYQHLKHLVDKGEEGWVEIVVVPSGGVLSPPRAGKNYMTAVVIQQHAFGQGSVHINSTNIHDLPIIDPRIADLHFDVLYEIVAPPASLKGDDEWVKFVKSAVRTTNHPLGTTAMAPRSLGDPRMKIYGLVNVRVVDASVIPLTTGVAIQSTVYAIAEKAADILRKEWGVE